MVLSRKLATQGHYPAIDVLESISRVMPGIISDRHLEASRIFKDILATYREAEDLINIGAYVQGTNPRIDYAIRKIEQFREFLKQRVQERYTFEESLDRLVQITQKD